MILVYITIFMVTILSFWTFHVINHNEQRVSNRAVVNFARQVILEHEKAVTTIQDSALSFSLGLDIGTLLSREYTEDTRIAVASPFPSKCYDSSSASKIKPVKDCFGESGILAQNYNQDMYSIETQLTVDPDIQWMQAVSFVDVNNNSIKQRDLFKSFVSEVGYNMNMGLIKNSGLPEDLTTEMDYRVNTGITHVNNRAVSQALDVSSCWDSNGECFVFISDIAQIPSAVYPEVNVDIEYTDSSFNYSGVTYKGASFLGQPRSFTFTLDDGFNSINPDVRLEVSFSSVSDEGEGVPDANGKYKVPDIGIAEGGYNRNLLNQGSVLFKNASGSIVTNDTPNGYTKNMTIEVTPEFNQVGGVYVTVTAVYEGSNYIEGRSILRDKMTFLVLVPEIDEFICSIGESGTVLDSFKQTYYDHELVYIIGDEGSLTPETVAAQQLVCLSNNQSDEVLKSAYLMINNADMSSTGNTWIPIGGTWDNIKNETRPFKGRFYGRNNSIKNLRIDTSGYSNSGGTIKKIVGDPTCPSEYSYDPVTNNCKKVGNGVSVAAPSCPSGYVYSADRNRCEEGTGTDLCIYCDETYCEAHPSAVTCVDCGGVQTDDGCMFVESAICPLGSFLNPNTDMCEEGNILYADAICAEGNLDVSLDKCYILAPNTNPGNYQNVGFFGKTEGEIEEPVVIRNLRFENLDLDATAKVLGQKVGGLAGHITRETYVNNVEINNSNITSLVTQAQADNEDDTPVVGGLIGQADDVNIQNSRVINTQVIGYERVGGLIGRTNKVTIEDSNVDNNGAMYIAGYKSLGGLVGYSANTNINSSYSKGRVQGNESGISSGSSGGGDDLDIALNNEENNSFAELLLKDTLLLSKAYADEPIDNTDPNEGKKYTNVGGLVGVAATTNINNSYSDGYDYNDFIDADINVGGLVGSAGFVNIDGSYVKNYLVTGYTRVGGLIGTSHDSKITNSYNNSFIGDHNSEYSGGLIGSAVKANISNSYNNKEVRGKSYVGGLIGKSLDTTTISNSYNVANVRTNVSAGGTGNNDIISVSIDHCYYVYIEGSGLLPPTVEQCVADIHTVTFATIAEKDSFCNRSDIFCISGTEYIKYKDISIETSTGGTGLAGGLVSHGEILNISNSRNYGKISGADYVGGLVGYSSRAYITSSYNSGEVAGIGDDSNLIGGLVGSAEQGSVSRSFNSGTVHDGANAGGIIGHVKTEFNISESYNSGNVHGDYSGGIVGYSDTGSTSITNANNSGYISGAKAAGILGGGKGSLSNTYSSNLSNVNKHARALVSVGDNVTISNSYSIHANNPSYGDKNVYGGTGTLSVSPAVNIQMEGSIAIEGLRIVCQPISNRWPSDPIHYEVFDYYLLNYKRYNRHWEEFGTGPMCDSYYEDPMRFDSYNDYYNWFYRDDNRQDICYSWLETVNKVDDRYTYKLGQQCYVTVDTRYLCQDNTEKCYNENNPNLSWKVHYIHTGEEGQFLSKDKIHELFFKDSETSTKNDILDDYGYMRLIIKGYNNWDSGIWDALGNPHPTLKNVVEFIPNPFN